MPIERYFHEKGKEMVGELFFDFMDFWNYSISGRKKISIQFRRHP